MLKVSSKHERVEIRMQDHFEVKKPLESLTKSGVRARVIKCLLVEQVSGTCAAICASDFDE
jgi:hypothetical protein